MMFQLQYFTMSIIALFLTTDTDGFQMVHTMVSYSSTPDMKRRLAHFASDIYLYYHTMIAAGHSIKNCSCLWSLIGMSQTYEGLSP